jgi:hypothetical protein
MEWCHEDGDEAGIPNLVAMQICNNGTTTGVFARNGADRPVQLRTREQSGYCGMRSGGELEEVI